MLACHLSTAGTASVVLHIHLCDFSFPFASGRTGIWLSLGAPFMSANCAIQDGESQGDSGFRAQLFTLGLDGSALSTKLV